MCLSTAYKVGLEGVEPVKLGEYISGVKVTDGKVILTDIMGAETEVPGSIRSMDFVKSEILIGD